MTAPLPEILYQIYDQQNEFFDYQVNFYVFHKSLNEKGGWKLVDSRIRRIKFFKWFYSKGLFD